MRRIMAKVKKERVGSKQIDKISGRKVLQKQEAQKNDSTDLPDTISTSEKAEHSSLRDAFKARLAGSRFRILNEEMYTTTSQNSFDKFSKNPELFEQYHRGFRRQVQFWEENPLDVIVQSLTQTYMNKKKPCVVADFGCGEAQLARDLLRTKSKWHSSRH